MFTVRAAVGAVAVVALACTCTSAHSNNLQGRQGAAPPEAAATPADRSLGILLSRDLADRFPGATVLGQPEFAADIVGGLFRYRAVGSELIVERPKEAWDGSTQNGQPLSESFACSRN